MIAAVLSKNSRLRDATGRNATLWCKFSCRHLLAASPAARTVSQAVVLYVPEAVAGASGAYWVLVGNHHQATHTLAHLYTHLS